MEKPVMETGPSGLEVPESRLPVLVPLSSGTLMISLASVKSSLMGVMPVVMVTIDALNAVVPPAAVVFTLAPGVTLVDESIRRVLKGGQFSRLDQLAVGRKRRRSDPRSVKADVSLMRPPAVRLVQVVPLLLEYCQAPFWLCSV